MRSTALQGFLLLSLATFGVVGQSSSGSLSIHSHITPTGGPHTSSGSSVTVSTSLPVSSGSSASGSSTVSTPATSSGSPSVPTSTAPTSTAPASTAPASTASTSANPATSAPSRALSVKASIGGLLGMVAIPLIFQL